MYFRVGLVPIAEGEVDIYISCPAKVDHLYLSNTVYSHIIFHHHQSSQSSQSSQPSLLVKPTLTYFYSSPVIITDP